MKYYLLPHVFIPYLTKTKPRFLIQVFKCFKLFLKINMICWVEEVRIGVLMTPR